VQDYKILGAENLTLVYQLIEILINFFEIYLGFSYLGLFYEKSKKKFVYKITILTVLIGVFVFVYNQYSLFSYILLLFVVIIMSVVSKIIYNCTLLNSISIISFYYTLITMIDICGIYVLELYNNQRNFGEELIFSTNKTRIIFIITMKLLHFIVYLIIKKNIESIKMFTGMHYKLLLIISVVAYLDFFIIHNIPESEVSLAAIIDWIYSMLLLVLLVMMFYLSFSYRNMMNENKKAEFLKKVLEEKNKNLRKIYNNDLRRFHDYKNHISLLKKYISFNQNEKALNYMNELVSSSHISYNIIGLEMIALIML
jgi:hypothetical protein